MSDLASAESTSSDEAGENGTMSDRSSTFVGWITALAVFGLLAAYFTWIGLQNVITVPPLISKNYSFYRANGLDGLVKPLPWVQLIVALVAPAVAYLGAVLIGRRRSLGRRIVLLLAAACAASAISASVSAYVTSTYQL